MARSVTCGIRKVALSTQREAESYLSGIADSIADVTFHGDRDEFYMNYAGGSLGRCDLHRGSHSAMSFTVKPSDEFHFIVLQKYGLRFKDGDNELEAAAQRSALMLTPHSKGSVHTPSGVGGISLITSAGAINAHVQKLLPNAARQDVSAQRATAMDLSDPVAMSFARNIVSVFHEMQSLGQSGLSSLACANFDELLLGLATTAVSPEVRKSLGGSDETAGAGSAVVRRARDYIRTHAAEPLRLADVAASLGIGLRALQIGFRREVGCSPREYLMTCRLELARSRLLAADDSMKVTTVALECGFTDLAVFSRKYRETFGELPSETVRRR
jgi:AraC-like DNA-binding protein